MLIYPSGKKPSSFGNSHSF